ncbi:MAG: hypothetical protein WCK60_00150 [Candidatus Nomurabacteria bacterium]
MENITQSSAETNLIKEEYKFPKFLKYFYSITTLSLLIISVFGFLFPVFILHSELCWIVPFEYPYILVFSYLFLCCSFFILFYGIFQSIKNKKASIFFIILVLFCIQFILVTFTNAYCENLVWSNATYPLPPSPVAW